MHTRNLYQNPEAINSENSLKMHSKIKEIYRPAIIVLSRTVDIIIYGDLGRKVTSYE